jgi:hypothetical protein
MQNKKAVCGKDERKDHKQLAFILFEVFHFLKE